MKSFVGAIGFSTSYEIGMTTGVLRPTFTGELSHEFADSGTVGITYAGIGGGTLYSRDAAARDRTDLTLGLGFDFLHANGWKLEGDVSAQLSGDGVVSKEGSLN